MIVTRHCPHISIGKAILNLLFKLVNKARVIMLIHPALKRVDLRTHTLFSINKPESKRKAERQTHLAVTLSFIAKRKRREETRQKRPEPFIVLRNNRADLRQAHVSRRNAVCGGIVAC